MTLWVTVVCAAWALVGPVGSALAQDRTLSRQMRLGIMFYERGEDAQAMDRFMDVLTRGEASERPLANEYINLISQRMNAGAAGGSSAPAKGPAPTVPEQAEPAPAVVVAPKVSASVRAPAAPEVAAGVAAPRVLVGAPAAAPRVAAPAAAAPAVVVEEPEKPRLVAPEPKARARQAEEDEADVPEKRAAPRADRETIEKDIRARIRGAFNRSMASLKENEDIRVIAQANGDPQAIAIPTPLLYRSGILFQKTAKPILDDLTGIAYSLKNAQLIILPEGTTLGDPKVLDMRRTMGISAHLYSAGVSPARVRVNLLSNQVEIPKPLRDFKGILVVFVYNRAPELVMESEAAQDNGPMISLGVHPERFDPDRDEGAVIEFSVLEPPAGLASWRFQLLRPSGEEGEDLAPLNQVVGSAPVFHQIYWNGRKSYFGQALPPGRYECVVTGTDARNRSRSLHRWIQVLGSAPQPAAALAASAAKAASGPPPADLASASARAADLEGADALLKSPAVKAGAAKRPGRRRGRRGPKPAAAKPGAAKAGDAKAGEGGAAAGGPEAGAFFEIKFAPGSEEIPPDGLAVIAKLAAQMAADARKVDLTGYAAAGSPDAAGLAQRRAQAAAGILLGKHAIPPERVQVRSAVSAENADKVEARFAEGP